MLKLLLLLAVALPVGYFATSYVGGAISNKTPTPTTDNNVFSNASTNVSTKNIPAASLPSLYNDSLTFTSAKRIDVISMEILTKAFGLAVSKGWKGSKTDPLPFALGDFGQTQLETWQRRSQEKSAGVKIPEELRDLYFGDTAVAEIESEVFKARSEYLDYLKAKNVHSAYINELESNTFPNDPNRFGYVATGDPNAPVTGVSSEE
jgi:hypothetical protein